MDMEIFSPEKFPPNEILRDLTVFQESMIFDHLKTKDKIVPEEWYDLNAPDRYFIHSIEKNQN